MVNFAPRRAARQEIIEAAAALFARQGFGSTTTAGIAARAGVSEGTLFHHFPTKRELLAELVFAVTDAAVRRLVLGHRWSEEEECLAQACAAVRALLDPDGTNVGAPDRTRGGSRE